MREVKSGDLLEFFDGEGFVSGTLVEIDNREDGQYLTLRVGNENQIVHHTDVVSVLKKKDNRAERD